MPNGFHPRTLALLLAAATSTGAALYHGQPAQEPRLLQCAPDGAPHGTDRKLVTRDSGKVELEVRGPRGVHQLIIPKGAVADSATFVLSARASERVEVEAHAVGRRTYRFANGRSATLRLDAEHCEDAFDRLDRKRVFRVDGGKMTSVGGGVVGVWPLKKNAMKVELDSLSGYAIGGN